MNTLNWQQVAALNDPSIHKPAADIRLLPEKVLQFGTGILLRALPDYFIDKANRQQLFNGRIVVVKSTPGHIPAAFQRQDHLYTLLIQGNQPQALPGEEPVICAAISRVLAAHEDWDLVLACATDPNIRIIISNTTEAGIRYEPETITQHPPASYPARLLAWLYHRFCYFKGNVTAGMVIIPTELVPENGTLLKKILLDLAAFNKMSPAFLDWLQEHNNCCNSLVDRIVPGTPHAPARLLFEQRYGYKDELAVITEQYALWAIEGDDRIREILSFHRADERIIITPDIEIYRVLKLYLLNGTHILCCGLALLSGLSTVQEAMEDPVFSHYLQALMYEEIMPAIPYQLRAHVAAHFIENILLRFRNPHIRHAWIDITRQYTRKLSMRVVPVLLQYYSQFKTPPARIALGIAAWIAWMGVTEKKEGRYIGQYQGLDYEIMDENAEWFYNNRHRKDMPEYITGILANDKWWGANLYILPGLPEKVTQYYLHLLRNEAGALLRDIAVDREK
ncbi:tagaturonate reductase [Chitinophaga pendula]|uniref:tagaturonate reductase n=1 Tax=Chitinophaga TaxID=79328 RepID=UPI0012FE0BC0|nr:MULTISPECIES: tagaturonate reductase [Chitinophaga]UCJ08295.1 tagaturonate reductase [Chitinophaga pendula]